MRGMSSPASEEAVNATLNRLPGVVAAASYLSQSLRLEFDDRQCPLDEIKARLESLGVQADFGRMRLNSVDSWGSSGAGW